MAHVRKADFVRAFPAVGGGGSGGGGSDYATYKAAIPSLVQWLRFHEASGIVAAAQVGGDGTYEPNSGGAWTGGTLDQAGIPGVSAGKAILLNGGGTVAVPYTPTLSPAEFSLECWLRTIEGPQKAYLANYSSGTYRGYALRRSFAGQAGIYVGSGSWLDGSAIITDGAWHHVVGVYADGIASIYVDGALCGSWSTTADLSDTGPLLIGGDSDANNITGTLAEPGIYNAALDATTILNLYTKGITA